jgi:ATP-dependent exoDNAse (exonuclease V) alpha subunit
MSLYLNKRKKKAGLTLSKLSYDKNSQDVRLLAGMPIISRVSNKDYDIMNNETFTIKEIKSATLIIGDDEKEIEIPHDKFQQLFYVAFCITVYKSQGMSFDHPYTIHEWSKFDNRMKYVALSRSTKKDYINIL